jgi:hypothetical protein
VFLRLVSCTNVTIRLKTSGVQDGNDYDTYSAKGIWLWGTNNGINISTVSTGTWFSVGVGGWWASGTDYWLGNTNITISSTNYNCRYGVDLRMTHGATVTNQSIGDATHNYASHRAVYVAGSTNVTAYSWSKDLNAQDADHYVTSNPSSVGNAGSSNVWLSATDLGSTYLPNAGRCLAKVGTVYSTLSAYKTTMSDITLDVHIVSDATKWNKNLLHATRIGSAAGVGAGHVFEGIKITGDWNRTASTALGDAAICYAFDNPDAIAAIASLELSLEEFTDSAPANGYTIIKAGGVSTTITACGGSLPRPNSLGANTTYAYTAECPEEVEPPIVSPPVVEPPPSTGETVLGGSAILGGTWLRE